MDKIGSYSSDEEGKSPEMASPSADEKLPELPLAEEISASVKPVSGSESASDSNENEKKKEGTVKDPTTEPESSEASEGEGSSSSSSEEEEEESKKEKKLSKRERTSSDTRPRKSRSRSHDRSHRRRRRSRDRQRHEPRRRRSSRSRQHRSKRSRSREHRRRKRSSSRSRSHRHHHDDSGRKRRNSHRRRHSRSPHRNFKEVMKQQLLKGSSDSRPVSVTMPTSGSANLVTMSASGERVTPQQALLQTMAAAHQRAQETTGVSIPKFYNPAAVNPMKYAEQAQKRKLLWGKDKKTPDEKSTTTGQWKATTFTGDQTGEQAAKFRRLMGMKAAEAAKLAGEELSEEQSRKQDELFHQLNSQYELARMATHTHRGIGLGFASQGMPGPSNSTQQR